MNRKGQTIFLGLIAFVVSIFLFSFSLPLMRSVIDSVWSGLGSVEQFMVLMIPFTIFFLIIFNLLRLLGGGAQ